MEKCILFIPETWQTLVEFAHWFLENGCPRKPPEEHHVFASDMSSSAIIFRQGRFQVEDYIMHPNRLAPRHAHPIGQVIVFRGGSMRTDSSIGGGTYLPRHVGTPKAISGELPVGSWHELQTWELGATFLNIQWWPEGLKMTSALLAYEGDSLGPVHEELRRGPS